MYTLPKFSKDTPKNVNNKEEFFKAFTRFNQKFIKELLDTLDPAVGHPVYTKRLDKSTKIIEFVLFFLYFESHSEIRFIFETYQISKHLKIYKISS